MMHFRVERERHRGASPLCMHVQYVRTLHVVTCACALQHERQTPLTLLTFSSLGLLD